MSVWLWLLVPLAPLLAAALLVWCRERVIGGLWLACLPALLAVWQAPAPLDLAWVGEGIRWGGEDALTRAWLGFTAVLWGSAGVFAASSQREDARRLRFWCFWLLALAGNLLLIVAADALSFYLGFSLMSLSAYGLIVHPGNAEARRAGRLYLQLAVLGEMLLLAGLMLRSHAAGGAFDFSTWRELPVDGPTLALLLVGLGLKAGFWPLHVWLPLAHPVAPAPASAVLSGAMLKAGILGLWRALPQDDPLLAALAQPLLAAGLFGALYAALLGLCASRSKAVLAWSSVSQMGWLLMILALAWRHPAQEMLLVTALMLFGVHHGLAKGALFLAAGMTHEARLPNAAWLLLALPALALAGLPLSTGGTAKAALKAVWYEGAFAAWLPLLSLAGFATSILLLRALWLMRLDQGQAPKRRPPPAQWLPWALLCSLSLLLPWLWPALRRPMLEHLGLADLWALLWPLLLAVVAAEIAVRRGWRVPRRLAGMRSPALGLSLRLKRLCTRPPLPELTLHPDRAGWRRRERRWNHLWRRDALALSAWLMALVLCLGWVWGG
ncbi:proton-conducting transporter transmembrane domain-containing protein [Stutzerimonas azotifigens]|uniref:proton-conducting transporter transmembrane domain-containing protein n=1 Tax=Stutzerimonas azotifigens TaxID=291995 RepID=UPI0003FF2975|nr:proton-conducting transporter membrane subunit [Stutzerimonas azotifigens]